MKTKILVIAPPRTGSTFYCVALSRSIGIKNIFTHSELFNFSFFVQSPAYDQKKSKTKLSTLHYRFFQKYNTLEKMIAFVKKQEKLVVKIHPSQILTIATAINGEPHVDAIYEDLFKLFAEHIYLYRKNFKDQVISHAAATQTSEWFVDRSGFTVTLSDNQLLTSQAKLISEYDQIKWLYEKYPGPVVALEDFGSHTDRYPEYQTITGNFDLIQDFDVEQEVFGIKRGGHCTPHPNI